MCVSVAFVVASAISWEWACWSNAKMPGDDIADPRMSGCPIGSVAVQLQLVCAAINFFLRQIRREPQLLEEMENNEMFRLFDEVQYHSVTDLNDFDCSALSVASFIFFILARASLVCQRSLSV